ncbi:MAG TPA: hypothetical protein VMB49_01940 [Acidobacteriaceae bacterium]|nr:hypothetical protein [Acidobacteriaceae bacterium]
MPRPLFPLTVMLLVLWPGAPLWGSSHSKEQPAPRPEESIPVQPLGYRPPGSLYLLSGRTFSTLDFIDAHHVLFTFHEPRLMHREEHPGRNDHDQIIHAVTLSVPDGKVQASAEWRMHDRARYLWALGGGRFLVRQRNTYFLADGSLKLRPYIEMPTPVEDTEVSPDGRILVVESEYEKHTPEEHRKLMEQAAEYGEPPPAEDTQITLVDIPTKDVLAAMRTENPVNLPITSNGYIGVTRGKGQDEFEIRFVPFSGVALTLGQVASTCTPHEHFVNQDALVIESCGPKSPDLYLDTWTTEGKKLWSGHREGHLVWPTFAYSRNGDRFAVSLLRVSHYIDLVDSLNDEDVREQVVQVFDSATGALLMSTTASPVLTGGQNFALSGDGEHLAVLRDGAIEVFSVPAPAPPEKAEEQVAKKR